MFSSPALIPLVAVQVSGRTCQRPTQTFDSGGTMLDEDSFTFQFSTCWQNSLVVSYHKRSHCGCLSRPGTQGSAISAFNPLVAQQCADRGSLPQSVEQWQGQLKHLHQRSTSSVGRK